MVFLECTILCSTYSWKIILKVWLLFSCIFIFNIFYCIFNRRLGEPGFTRALRVHQSINPSIHPSVSDALFMPFPWELGFQTSQHERVLGKKCPQPCFVTQGQRSRSQRSKRLNFLVYTITHVWIVGFSPNFVHMCSGP